MTNKMQPRAGRKTSTPNPEATSTATAVAATVAVEPQQIRGMVAIVEDDSTGVSVPFHRVEGYTIDFRNKSVSCVVLGYASETKYNEGRKPLMQHQFNFGSLPPRGTDPLPWVYEQMTAIEPPPVAEGEALSPDDKVKFRFSGAPILR